MRRKDKEIQGRREIDAIIRDASNADESAGFSPVTREHLSSRCDQAWMLSLSPDSEAG
jgi:hypothetical protein